MIYAILISEALRLARVNTVLHATHTFIHKWNKLSCYIAANKRFIGKALTRGRTDRFSLIPFVRVCQR